VIRRIELHNFATHENTEVEFGDGKNIIIGGTGSGKTNLLLAVDFAFMGEVPNANLAELIADDADAAEAILYYIDQRTGQSYSIHRTLTRETDGRVTHECTLTNLDTKETVEKPAPVQKTLETLGVVPSVFRNVVHVAQGKFADLLDETQERKSSLDRLFQISQLENTYQELGRQEGPIRQIELRRQSNLEKKGRLETAASKLEEEKAILGKLEAEREAKQARLDEARKEHGKLEEVAKRSSEALTKLQGVQDRLTKAETTVRSCTTQIETLTSQLRQFLSPVECSKIEKQRYEETKAYLEKLRSDLEKLKANQKSLTETHKIGLAELTTTQSHIDRAKEEQANSSVEIDSIQKYLQGKAELPKIQCDRCGSILTKEQWKKHIVEKQTSLKELDEKIEQLIRKLKGQQVFVQENQTKIDDADSRIRNVTSGVFLVEQLASQRQELEKSSSSRTMLLEEQVAHVNELRRLFEAKPEQADQEVVNQALLVKERLSLLSKQMLDLTRDLKSYDESQLKPQQKRVSDAEESASQLRKLEPEIRLDEKKIQLLQTIRSSLREIQPVVRRSFVSKITASANDYLKRLYGGTEIESFELTEDYEFLVTRAGHKRHANRLSGGQQVLASMAFLLALSEVLSQLDFLILDEPTTHLDENRRKELVNVLENLRRVPQLIIVDHHPELLVAADTRFHVSLTPEGMSQVEQTEG
jgi:exonuclease SbcC